MDTFFSLSSGAKFDKKKIGNEIKLLKTPKPVLNSTNPIYQGSIVPKELDFFNEQSSSIKTKETLPSKIVEPVTNEEPIIKIQPLNNRKLLDEFKKLYRIKTYGTDIPNPLQSFDELYQKNELIGNLLKNVKNLPYDKMTPIQMQSIPIIIEGRDLLACAPTGTGKTMAYTIPTITNLKQGSKDGYRVIVIAPTRELAKQIHNEFQVLSNNTSIKIHLLTKATSAGFNQPEETRPKGDVLVTTPLRLVSFIKDEKVDLSKVTQLIFDEADKLFELGFVGQIDHIVAGCTHPSLRKALFSATIPAGVEQLANTITNDPIRVVIGNKDGATELIDQKLIYCGQENGKLMALRNIIKEGIKPPVVIFVQSTDRANQLFKELCYDNLHADVIHAQKSQSQRDSIMAKFRQGSIWVLIATDLLARGLDFHGIELVINYDFPQSVQSYVHRIGRTGRAGQVGKAITLFTDIDSDHLKSVANVMVKAGCQVQDWMLELKKPTRKQKNELKRKPMERDDINKMAKFDKKNRTKTKNMIKASKAKKNLNKEIKPSP